MPCTRFVNRELISIGRTQESVGSGDKGTVRGAIAVLNSNRINPD